MVHRDSPRRVLRRYARRIADSIVDTIEGKPGVPAEMQSAYKKSEQTGFFKVGIVTDDRVIALTWQRNVVDTLNREALTEVILEEMIKPIQTLH